MSKMLEFQHYLESKHVVACKIYGFKPVNLSFLAVLMNLLAIFQSFTCILHQLLIKSQKSTNYFYILFPPFDCKACYNSTYFYLIGYVRKVRNFVRIISQIEYHAQNSLRVASDKFY